LLIVGFRPHLQLFSELLLFCLRCRRAKLAVVVVSLYEFAVLYVSMSACRNVIVTVLISGVGAWGGGIYTQRGEETREGSCALGIRIPVSLHMDK
jgi:hypothetical protein